MTNKKASTVRRITKLSKSDLLDILENLTVRFPLEFKTDLDTWNCKCLQFEDHGTCRHLIATRAVADAEEK